MDVFYDIQVEMLLALLLLALQIFRYLQSVIFVILHTSNLQWLLVVIDYNIHFVSIVATNPENFLSVTNTYISII